MFYRNYNITGFLFRVFLTLIVISSPAVQAVQQSTVPVHGRAPTTILSVNTIQPRVGDVITVTSVFNDADGDAEQGTTYQWTLDGTAISGANSPSYTLSINDIQAGSELNVTVTPQTDPNITLPSVGLPVQLDHPINIQWQRTISRLVWAESPLGVVADGQAVNTVHATVQYLDGTPAVGATVLFEADNSGSILSSAQSGNDGVATAYVTNVVAGTSRVTARIDDDIEFINTRFVAGPVDVVQAEVTQDNALANGLDDNRVLVSVEDSKGNAVVGETVSFTATNGVELSAISGKTDSNGNVIVALTSHSAISSDITASTTNGTSDTVTVKFFSVQHMTHLLVNDASFSVNRRFPETGFIGAKFQLVIGEDPAGNSAYNWSSNQSWVSVDGSGNVRFNQEPTSANNRVTVTAEHQTSGSLYTYQFTVNRWFRNNGSTLMGYINAAVWCSSQSGDYAIPSYTEITDRTPAITVGSNRSANGRLWNEWGNMSSYSNGWIGGNHWSSELVSGGNAQYYVNLGTGSLFSLVNENGTILVSCSKSI